MEDSNELVLDVIVRVVSFVLVRDDPSYVSVVVFDPSLVVPCPAFAGAASEAEVVCLPVDVGVVVV